MGQDRVRPLALALQGLDYTVRGQTVGGGRGECVVAEEGWMEREGAGGRSGCGGKGERGGTGECSLICQQEVRDRRRRGGLAGRIPLLGWIGFRRVGGGVL